MILIHRFHFLHMVCSDGRKGNKNGEKTFVYSKGWGTKEQVYKTYTFSLYNQKTKIRKQKSDSNEVIFIG